MQSQTKYIPEKEAFINPTLGIWQESYPLGALEFEYLLNGKPTILKYTTGFFFALIGYLITIVPKLFNQYFDNQPNMVTKGDWCAIIFGIVIIFITYVISLLCPNNYKKTVQSIESHFKQAKTQKMFRR